MTLKKKFTRAALFAITVLLAVPRPLAAVGAQPAGNYYSMQFTNWPPMPANIFDLEAAELAPGVFLLNDLDVDYGELTRLNELMESVGDLPPLPPDDGGTNAGGLIPSPAGVFPFTPIPTFGCSVGLLPLQYQVTNVIVTITNVGGIGEFDIFTTPSLNTPVWKWLVRLTNGQTTFTVSNPPQAESYYMAACTNALRQWLVGSIVTTNSPDRITVWPDQSGNANHASSTSPNARPVWVSNTINGLPVVRFYLTNSFALNLSSLITNWTEAEAFLVLKVATNKPAANRGLWRIGSGSGGNGTAYATTNGEITDTFGSTKTAFNVGSTSQGLTNFHLYNPMSRNGEWVVRLNGATKYRSANNSVGFYANPTLGTSAWGNFDGDIAEVLLYNRVLTATERQNVNQYLQGNVPRLVEKQLVERFITLLS